MTDATCAFSIPNMTDEWYGFFEKPSMSIDSIEKVTAKTWRIRANARAAYCANFCRSPQLRFAFSFRPDGIDGANNAEKEDDNNNNNNNNKSDAGRIEGLVGIDVNENVPSTVMSAKLNGSSNRKVSIRNLSHSFRNQQRPIHAFCDEYGAQYRTHLTIQIDLQFVVVVDDDLERPPCSSSSYSTASCSTTYSNNTDCENTTLEEVEKEREERGKEEENEEQEEVECCVCLDARATMMNETCKHTVMCHTCAFAFLSRSKELQQPYSCPICRAQIGNMYIDTKAI